MKLLDRFNLQKANIEDIDFDQVVPYQYCLIENLRVSSKLTLPSGTVLCKDSWSVVFGKAIVKKYPTINDIAVEAVIQISNAFISWQDTRLEEDGSKLPNPLVPSNLFQQSAKLTGFEVVLERVMVAKHLYQINNQPRMDIQYREELVATSRAKKVSNHAHRYLASHSETWQEGLEEENDRLEVKVTELDDELYELRAAHEKSLAELYANRLSSQEKYQLTKEKQVLTAYNQSLDINIEQLSRQLDELKGNDKDQLAFKALNEMDEKHRSEAINLQPVPELRHFAEIMQANIAKQAFFYSIEDIRLFIAGLAMSKLHLLQGISGTGKTSLARTFARAVNNVYDKEKEALYCEIVRVQAGWRDKEDLIGYYNEFEKKFNTKEALQAIYRAQQPEFKDTVQIILLDEMNLSQPEQYFADFLSLLETPDRAIINLLDHGSDTNPKLFVDKKAIEIPDNVWFIGTANHDETTKEFADKTYDRAHVMEVKRSKEKCSTELASNEQFSFTSLIDAFQKAESKGKKDVEKIFEKLRSSELEESLNLVGVSWGNRLEIQAKSFIPVYMACGGKESEALDHLLATKVFRRGKLTGRYDISAEQMQGIRDYLDEMWIDLGYGDNDSPCYSHAILDQDIQRLGDL